MKEVLLAHAPILKEIPQVIAEKYNIRAEQIKLVNVSSSDEGSMSFQLSFDDPISEPPEEIALNFELQEQAPHLLYFETLTGLKGYEKANSYYGLNNEIFKYITAKTGS